MRSFYIKYPKFQTPEKSEIRQTSGKSVKRQTSGKLSWSHYSELLTVSDDLARSFYEKQAIKENWSFRELKRQIDSALFQRLALSKDKKGVLALAERGQQIAASKGEVIDPANVYQEDTRIWSVAKSDGSQTFYVKYGDWFAWLCSMVTARIIFRRRRW